MPYVGFLDMLGTRAKASLSEKDYTNAVDSFNDKLSAYSDTYNAKVYAYSDNAYVQFNNSDNMIDFGSIFLRICFVINIITRSSVLV